MNFPLTLERSKPAQGVIKTWCQAVSEYARQSSEPEIVADFHAVESIQSSDLNELVKLRLELSRENKSLVLENVRQHISSIFEITRLNRIIELRNVASS